MAEQLDQFQTVNGGATTISPNLKHAQTFRPSQSGLLSRIELHSHSNNAADFLSIVEISIVETVNMVPNGAVLGTVYFDWPKTEGWLSFDYRSQDIGLQADQEYAIVLTADRSRPSGVTYGDELTVEWNANPYSRGQLWQFSGSGPWERFNAFGRPGNSDLAFKSYMVIPEPANLTIVATALILMTCMDRTPR